MGNTNRNIIVEFIRVFEPETTDSERLLALLELLLKEPPSVVAPPPQAQAGPLESVPNRIALANLHSPAR